MQHKHKRRSHAKPIVPVHTAAPAAPQKPKPAAQVAGNAAANGTVTQKQQKHGKQQHQQMQQRRAQSGAGASQVGKRKVLSDSQQQPPPQKKQHKQVVPAGGSTAPPTQKQQPQQVKHAGQQPPQQQQQQQAQLSQANQRLALQQPKQQDQPPRQHQVAAHTSQAAAQNRHDKKRKRKQQAANVDAAAATKQSKAAEGSRPSAAAAAAAAVAAAVVKPWQPKQPSAISSNWQALKQQLQQEQAAKPKRPRRGQHPAAAGSGASQQQIGSTGRNKAVTPIVAMDCEMVGVGQGGERDSLARVSIVNASGHVLLDAFVAQKEPVTDYRTWVSGITPQNLVGAADLAAVQQQVAELLQGRMLVGHGLKKDLAVLLLSHPRKNIRDTAKYPPFMFSKGGKRRPRALRALAQQELGLTIQEGQHSSVDDARAALYLYQKHAATWERALKTPNGLKELPTANRPAASKKKKRVESYHIRDVKDDPMADL